MAWSSLTRISTCRDWPTVSIQNGRLTLVRISSDSARSSRSKNGLGCGVGRLPGGSTATDRPNRFWRDVDQLGDVVLAGARLVEVDDRGDVARHALRQPARHLVPVPLHEGEGDHAFQQHDRRDDDDEGAGVEALRRQLAERARKARAQGRRAASSSRRASLRQLSADWRVRACASVVQPLAADRRFSRCGVCSPCRARSAGRRDWPDRSRSCGAAG